VAFIFSLTIKLASRWYKDRGERTVIIKKRHRHWDD